MGANGEVIDGTGLNMAQSRETLRQLIAQWNANRLDLFEISEPNEVTLLTVKIMNISIIKLFEIYYYFSEIHFISEMEDKRKS